MLAVLATALFVSPQGEIVDYRLTLSGASAQTVAVEMRVPAHDDPATLVIPRAIPMGYGTAPYDRFYRDVRAFHADGTELDVARARFGPRITLGRDGQGPSRVTWRVDVDAMEANILSASDTSKMREGYVGLLGYSVFAYIEGLDDRSVRLTVDAPEGWPIFSTLAPQAPPATGEMTVDAANFYALADSQLLLGPHLIVHRVVAGDRPAPLPDQPERRPRFDAEAPPLFVAGYAQCDVDLGRIGDLGQLALESLVDWFGSAPFEHYTMVVEFVRPRSSEHRYGFSMEHLDSGTFFFTVDDAITGSIDAPTAKRVLYNYAHHIAHSWIPKRCAMAGYYPFPWEFAPALDSIWFSEGFGQFVAADALDNVIPGTRDRIVRQRFRRSLQLTPRSLRRLPLVEVSRMASTQYSEHFGTGINVFARGGLMAADIDTAIRVQTDGRQSLKHGLRQLIATCAETGTPCDVDGLVGGIEKATGVDTRAIVNRWLAPVTDAR